MEAGKASTTHSYGLACSYAIQLCHQRRSAFRSIRSRARVSFLRCAVQVEELPPHPAEAVGRDRVSVRQRSRSRSLLRRRRWGLLRSAAQHCATAHTVNVVCYCAILATYESRQLKQSSGSLSRSKSRSRSGSLPDLVVSARSKEGDSHSGGVSPIRLRASSKSSELQKSSATEPGTRAHHSNKLQHLDDHHGLPLDDHHGIHEDAGNGSRRIIEVSTHPWQQDGQIAPPQQEKLGFSPISSGRDSCPTTRSPPHAAMKEQGLLCCVLG